MSDDAYPGSPTYSRTRTLVHNLPYVVMLLLGMAVLVVSAGVPPWNWLWAGGYCLYGLSGAVWIIVFLCPYCPSFGTRQCPCGYGDLAPRFRSKQDSGLFRRKFRMHMPIVFPLWLVPPIVGGIAMWRHPSALVIGLVTAFAVESFLILPLVATRVGCVRCPLKDTCPWMTR